MLTRACRSGRGAVCAVSLVILSLALFNIFLSPSPRFVSVYNHTAWPEVRINALQDGMAKLRLMDKENIHALLELQNQTQHLLRHRTSSWNDQSKENQINKNSSSQQDGKNISPRKLRPALLSTSEKNESKTSVRGSPRNDAGFSRWLMELRQKGLVADSSAVSMDMVLPGISDQLPHLLQNSNALYPRLRISKNRRGARMAIGIPTVKRHKVSYLATCLKSLIDNLRPKERSKVLIVVFIADMNATSDSIERRVAAIYKKFPDAIEEGLLELIVPPESYYPDLGSLSPTLGDPPLRMKWRTKQNLDFAYLMMYCRNRAQYYLQLEDDIVTKPGYYRKMKKYVRKQSKRNWYMLEFSSLGFIGKLFRSSDLPLVISFLLMFYKEKPGDWILDDIFYVRLCSHVKSWHDCKKLNDRYRLHYKPSLFQHVGVHSSLKGKMQNAKETDFGTVDLYKPHADNPPAVITTSLETYQDYSLDGAYRGDTFFWALAPQAGNWIEFLFSPPIGLEGFVFRSGTVEHPDDLFYNTTVEINFTEDDGSQFDIEEDETVPYPRTDDGYYVVAWFNQGGAAQASLNTIGDVSSLRLVMHSGSDNDAILSEIWIRQAEDEPTHAFRSSINLAQAGMPSINPSREIRYPIDSSQVIRYPIDSSKVISAPIDSSQVISAPLDPSHVIRPPLDPSQVIRPPIDPSQVIRPSIDPSQVIRPPIDPSQVIRPPIDPSQVIRPPIDPSQVIRPPIDPSQVIRPPIDPSQVIRPSIDPSQVIRPPIDPSQVIRPPIDPSQVIRPPIDPSQVIRPSIDLSQVIRPPIKPSQLIKAHTDPEQVIRFPIDTTRFPEGAEDQI